MKRLTTTTHRSRQSAELRVCAMLMMTIITTGCVKSPASIRPSRLVSYWEAIAVLHPAAAIAVARTEAETMFAEGLQSLMAGEFEKAERDFGQLRRIATDSTIRNGSRVVYTATLQ